MVRRHGLTPSVGVFERIWRRPIAELLPKPPWSLVSPGRRRLTWAALGPHLGRNRGENMRNDARQ